MAPCNLLEDASLEISQCSKFCAMPHNGHILPVYRELPQILMITKIEEPVYPSLVFNAVIKLKDKNEK
jgi:hypothetical protein